MNKLELMPGEANVTFSDTENGGRKVDIVAYNGGKMSTNRGVVAVDLESLRVPSTILLLTDHDNTTSGVIGHGEAKTDGRSIHVSGLVTSHSEKATNVMDTGKAGTPFQASIGVRDFTLEHVKRGNNVSVNGRTIEGPVAVVRGGELYETSIVPFGADSSTSVLVANFPEEEESMKEENGANVEAQQPIVATVDVDAAVKAAQVSERKRIKEIDEVINAHSGKHDLRDLREQAIDGYITLAQLKDQILAMYHANEPKAKDVAPEVVVKSHPRLTAGAIEAAILASAGIGRKTIEDAYSERDLELADHMSGIGLQGAVVKSCQLDGVSVPDTFGWRGDKIKAAASSVSLPGILGNVLNKMLLDSYNRNMGVAQAICGNKAVTDFKAVYSYRPNESMEFEEVGADGELKSVSFAENSMSNQAKTYGKYIQLTRQMLINDDLDYFAGIPRQLGQGGAQCVEKTIIKLLLGNGNVTNKKLSAQGVPAASTAAFFSSTWANLLTGAAYALGITTGYAGWEAARLKMRLQQDYFGEPLNVTPAICLVPPELETYALRLANSESLAIAGSTDVYNVPTWNQFAGKMRILVSPYLSLATMTGYSTTAYYLSCEPSVIEGIQLAWLNNVRAPVIESVDVRSEVLGTAWRSYLDFGAALQDPRGMVKVTGAD